jgi:glycosyltransferase involved in cell wall biosynthesis
VLVCDFLAASVNVPPGPLGPPAVLFEHNVEAMVWKRLADVETRQPHRWYLMRQWRKGVAYESAACKRFDKVIAVSPEDAARIEREYGAHDVASVPLGVDLEYFRPRPDAPTPRPRGLVFTGSLDWLPNDDGVCWFLRSVWPRICQTHPDASVTIVGREPSPALQSLAAAAPGAVRVTGRVPDVRPFVEESSVFIVPLRVGGGTRLKIYEAMAMEKPVVSTTIGAEGLPLTDGVHLLRADSEDAFAASVCRMFEDAELSRSLGSNGAQFVRSACSWSVAARTFAKICGEMARSSQTGNTHPEASETSH